VSLCLSVCLSVCMSATPCVSMLLQTTPTAACQATETHMTSGCLRSPLMTVQARSSSTAMKNTSVSVPRLCFVHFTLVQACLFNSIALSHGLTSFEVTVERREAGNRFELT